MKTLTIRDETAPGKTINEWKLELAAERLSVRELIRSRVYQEVQDYNLNRTEVFQGLVQPTEAEQTLNGPANHDRCRLDWKTQFDRAVEAFLCNQVFILIDDRQAETLDEEIVVSTATEVTFLRLIPLVGG